MSGLAWSGWSGVAIHLRLPAFTQPTQSHVKRTWLDFQGWVRNVTILSVLSNTKIVGVISSAAPR